MGKKGTHDWSKTKLPVGSIRIRRIEGGGQARKIKVHDGRPRHTQWILYARWWWLQNRGPVPDGKCVLHRDGDTLNDDPANFALGGTADRAAIFHHRIGAEASARVMAKAHAGAARHNVERARARRLMSILQPTLWYAVDHQARVISGPFGKKRHYAYRAMGVPVPACLDNPRSWLASQLGWPGMWPGMALTLAVLAEVGEPLASPELLRRAIELSSQLGQPWNADVSDNRAIHQPLYQLRKTGLIVSRRHGAQPSTHAITRAALDQRGPVYLVAVLRGADCEPFEVDGYTVVCPNLKRGAS